MGARVLVIGGAGFIGTNAAEYFARQGHDLLVVDNLSRRGTETNLAYLQSAVSVAFERLDIRDGQGLALLVKGFGPDVVLHLAGQVAVTTSVADPVTDFDINARGTVNVLEALRLHAPEATLLFASTNKVYGGLDDCPPRLDRGRYVLDGLPRGVSEDRPLDFHSPYGCSKGAADQYVRDYSRIYGLSTVVFRQSCIYGPHQFGVEDQGWVAWFVIAALLGFPLTIYGDGRQVRDVLAVDDLVRAYDLAWQRIRWTRGRIYNIGGGPDRTLSLLELLEVLRDDHHLAPARLTFAASRPGDQLVYVSALERAEREFGWMPQITPRSGVASLVAWVNANRDRLQPFFPSRDP
jgi:CDP-paratose 2-epimerase